MPRLAASFSTASGVQESVERHGHYDGLAVGGQQQALVVTGRTLTAIGGIAFVINHSDLARGALPSTWGTTFAVLARLLSGYQHTAKH